MNLKKEIDKLTFRMHAHVVFTITSGKLLHNLCTIQPASLTSRPGGGSCTHCVRVPLVLKIGEKVKDAAQNADPLFIVIVSKL